MSWSRTRQCSGFISVLTSAVRPVCKKNVGLTLTGTGNSLRIPVDTPRWVPIVERIIITLMMRPAIGGCVVEA